MALGAVLVDRARILRRAPAPVRVEGRTQFTTVTGAWFRCRLDLRSRSEGREPESGFPRVVEQPSLMFGVRDTEGRTVDLAASDRLEVVSPQLGRALWQAQGDPIPMRKRRRVIGWEATIKRVEEHAFDETGAMAGGTG
jgi:hypothetical protein